MAATWSIPVAMAVSPSRKTSLPRESYKSRLALDFQKTGTRAHESPGRFLYEHAPPNPTLVLAAPMFDSMIVKS
jgi:hypothetical protein